MALFRETGDARWRAIVERTLDAMADGGLWDARDGGFYRYATTRDWQLPHTEKLLETNAELLRAYAEAGAACSAGRSIAIAAPRSPQFITGDAARRRRRLPRQRRRRDALHGRQRRRRPGRCSAPPPCSTTARSPGRRWPRSSASCSCATSPGAALAHYSDGVARVRGLLARSDLHAIGALLDAHDVSALEPYRMMAEELGHFAVRDLWDEAGGGFFDRAASDGRHRPAADAAQAVRRQRRGGVDRWRGSSATSRRSRVSRATPPARCTRRRRSSPARDRSPRTTCSRARQLAERPAWR